MPVLLAFSSYVLLAHGAETELISGYARRPAGTITYTREIAPMIYQHCAGCHRPGQSGPFPLEEYAQVRKRGRLIAEVVVKRLMPPWQPEPGYVEYEGQRGLTSDQIGLIQQWVGEGAAEGNPSDLPPKPAWPEGWELGKPDLILTVPEPYQLPAAGRDVYRALVVPVRLEGARYVRALEFHPQNTAVHHAFFRIDRTPESRRRDEQDPGPGFSGMDLPSSAETPGGHFLSWQIGKGVYFSGAGSAWRLPKAADFVMQLHLNPSGKIEAIQPEVGLYFTGQAPTNFLYKILLSSAAMDIPAGARDYVVGDSYRLPCDLRAVGINPHVHYLGKELQGYAILPDGRKQWLLYIKHWNFLWQGNYRFKDPLFLPKGTVVKMRYTYDNSDANPMNPNHPARRVTYGLQTTDEMAELWIQFTGTQRDLDTLDLDYSEKFLRLAIEECEIRLKRDPKDATVLTHLGTAKLAFGRTNEAIGCWEAAIQARPDFDEPHYQLGVLAHARKNLKDAKTEFHKALDLNPKSYKACGVLGMIAAEEADVQTALRYFHRALEIFPDDEVAKACTDELLKTLESRAGKSKLPPAR